MTTLASTPVRALVRWSLIVSDIVVVSVGGMGGGGWLCGEWVLEIGCAPVLKVEVEDEFEAEDVDVTE